MKISAIARQQKRSDRYSVFVDGKYTFSLSESALIESKLAQGQELTAAELKRLKQLAGENKLYNQTLRWVAYKSRTEWEADFYLTRKHFASTKLRQDILNKLKQVGLLDDHQYVASFISDRTLLKPTSKRKITMELRRKHIDQELIAGALAQVSDDAEEAALISVIERKRRTSTGRYKDDLKLMQYLARQGFNYEDIKSALKKIKQEEIV
ncbi:MAG: RecX family transcriptional regulator [Candidatus Saccharimonadales bacterium]